MANDLGFTEITIAALLGHASGSITSRYVHTLDSALIMAADTVSGYIQALIEGAELSFTHYALDRSSRTAALARFLAPRPDRAPRSEERRVGKEGVSTGRTWWAALPDTKKKERTK